MTPNIFKEIIYRLETIVHCPPRFFYGRRQSFSNQHEVNNNYSAKGSKMYTCMADRDK